MPIQFTVVCNLQVISTLYSILIGLSGILLHLNIVELSARRRRRKQVLFRCELLMLIPLISLECSSPVIVQNRAENVRLITEIYKKIIVTLFEQGNIMHHTYSHIFSHASFIHLQLSSHIVRIFSSCVNKSPLGNP